MKCHAATGHRPSKLGGYGDDVGARLRRLATDHLIETRPDCVISGMALGWDIEWAVAAIALGIPVLAALPFIGQADAWPKESQARHRGVLAKCAHVTIVCDGGYSPHKMQRRNEWMVDHATELVALWDGSSGGTWNCIKYAKKKLPIINLWPQWLAMSNKE